MAIVAMGVVSCHETNVELPEVEVEESVGRVLHATIEGQSTRIAFEEDSDTKSIKLEWELGDAFTVYYNTGNGYFRYSDYTCTDVETETFTCSNASALPLGDYIAVYPASELMKLDDVRSRDLVSEQDGDKINDLDGACVMEAEFTLTSNDDISSLNFKHQKAVMSFYFSISTFTNVSKLIFENGDESYTVNFDTSSPLMSYTSHIMINPCEEGERTLRFEIYDQDGGLLETRATTSTKAYLAGYRYIATLSNYALKRTGTSSDPYLIETAADMWDLSTASQSDNFDGKYFLLTQDIDLGCTAEKQWVPIGNFDGYFNGGGHVISGLYMSGNSNQALFTSNDGEIANLGVDGEVLGSSSATFAVVNNGTIVNCWSNVEFTPNISSVGFAYMNNKYIKNCYKVGYSEYGTIGVSGDEVCVLQDIYVLSGSYEHLYQAMFESLEEFMEDIADKSESEMKSKSFVYMLNNGAFDYNLDDVKIKACAWVYNEGGYPQLDGEGEPTLLISGEGTFTSPYLIASEEALVYLSELSQTETFEGKYIKQTADITLTSEWSPIGNASCFFSGHYYGSGYKISGLKIDNSSDFQGFFGVVASGAYISNVGISGGEISATNGCIGAIAGENHGSIYSCYNAIDVTGTSNVGGIVGQNYGTIEACYNKGAVTATGTYAGGIAGKNNGGTINSVYNMGTISGSSAYGVAGISTGGSISACYTIGGNLYYFDYSSTSGLFGASMNTEYTTLDDFNSSAFCTELNNALTTDAWVYSILNYGEYPQLINNIESSTDVSTGSGSGSGLDPDSGSDSGSVVDPGSGSIVDPDPGSGVGSGGQIFTD